MAVPLSFSDFSQKKTLSRNWNRHLSFFSKTLVALNLHFSLSVTKSKNFPMPESQKLVISEGHLKSESAKTFMSNKQNWYPSSRILKLLCLSLNILISRTCLSLNVLSSRSWFPSSQYLEVNRTWRHIFLLHD